jgi:hypothetical protein
MEAYMSFENSSEQAKAIAMKWGLVGLAIDNFADQVKKIALQMDVDINGDVRLVSIFLRGKKAPLTPIWYGKLLKENKDEGKTKTSEG